MSYEHKRRRHGWTEKKKSRAKLDVQYKVMGIYAHCPLESIFLNLFYLYDLVFLQ